MGRTLHWDIRPKGKQLFDIQDLKIMYEIDKTADKACEWTCESFDLSVGIYPNWETKSSWDKVNARYDELQKKGMHPVDINFQLVKEKLVSLHNPEWQQELSGFCKVGGNELNAAIITGALAEVSKKVSCSIDLKDEGEYLICPIIMEQGHAMPNQDKIIKDIGWWLTRKWDAAYNTDTELLAKVESSAKEYYEISQKYKSKYYPPRCLWSVSEFCRTIKPEDFQNHPEYGASQIMAGFDGEYYGLSKKDPESESYKACANIQKMIEKIFGAKVKDMKMVIGKEIGKQDNKKNEGDNGHSRRSPVGDKSE
ncbi:MAG: hypothetical protein WC614_07605 [bacterium]